MSRFAFFFLILSLSYSLRAQTPAERLAAWNAANPSVKPYLFFNQSRYAPGDTALIKAYVLKNNVPLEQACILNVSVVNTHAREVSRAILRVERGVTSNQLVLPDSLEAGFYRFVAYNEQLTANPASVVFEKEFEVVGTQELLKIKSPAGVRFYPEGGTLVAGITNKVVVNAPDITTESVADLVGDLDRTITSLKLIDGFGFVHFKPELGKSYHVRLNNASFKLPSASDDGVGVLLTPGAGKSNPRVILSAPPTSAFRLGNLHVLLHMNGVVYSAQEVALGDKEYQQFTIPVTALPSGVAILTVLSNTGNLVAERRFYVGETVTATLTAIRPTTQTRGLVEVEVKLTDTSGAPVSGEFAVSAVNQRLFPEERPATFRDELIFNGQEHLTGVQSGRRDLLDLRLTTVEPLQAPWKDAPGSALSREAGMFLHFRGMAIDQSTLAPVPDSTQLLLYLQKDAMGYVTSTDAGMFDLHTLLDFNGTDDVYYEAELRGKRLRNVKINWMNVVPRFNKSSASRVLPTVNAYADFSKKARLINQSYEFFIHPSSADAVTARNPNQLLEDEAGGADVTVNLNEFIAFPNMDEVIREIIPSLVHRKQGDKSIVRVALQNTDKMPKADPLYIIDGLMTRDTEYFIDLKPSDVLTIKVIRDVEKLAQMGPFGSNGIVFVQTKIPNPQRVRAGSNFTSLQGVSMRLPTKSIDHTSISQPLLPDFRSTLYWNPTIKTDAQGKAVIRFFASDDVGPIRLNIVGLTSFSMPFSGTTTIQVEFAEEVYKR